MWRSSSKLASATARGTLAPAASTVRRELICIQHIRLLIYLFNEVGSIRRCSFLLFLTYPPARPPHSSGSMGPSPAPTFALPPRATRVFWWPDIFFWWTVRVCRGLGCRSTFCLKFCGVWCGEGFSCTRRLRFIRGWTSYPAPQNYFLLTHFLHQRV